MLSKTVGAFLAFTILLAPSVAADVSTTIQGVVVQSSSVASVAASVSPTVSAGVSSSATSSGAAATHTVAVGADGLTYQPSTIFATVGDIVKFNFYPLNHSVARAAYEQPCIPYEWTGPNLVGFWSGFMPTNLVSSNPPSYSLRVNDTNPIFFYCSAPGACMEGMVGVINPSTTQTFDVQLAFAKNSTVEYSPGQAFPVESSAPPTSSPTSGSTPTGGASSGSSSSSKLSGGAIAGIVVGAIAVIILGALVFYMCGRQKTLSQLLHNNPNSAKNNDSEVLPHPPVSQGHATPYNPSIAGMSEAHYKSPDGFSAGRFSHMTGYGAPTETESYRSMSPPPADERTSMMTQSMMVPPLSYSNPSSPGYPHPAYQDRHELDPGTAKEPLSPAPIQEVHELPSHSPVSPPVYQATFNEKSGHSQ